MSSLKQSDTEIQSLLSIAAIGYYGSGGDYWQREDDPPAKGFVSELCVDWEQAVKPVRDMGIRLAIFRVGLVLSEGGGLLDRFKLPIKLGVAPYFGNGRNFYSWIHIDDLCRIFLHALGNASVSGTYNAVAPNPKRTRDFVKSVARGMSKPAIALPVPLVMLKVVMGKRGELPFHSNRVANDALLQTGFEFRFATVEEAISDLFRK